MKQKLATVYMFFETFVSALHESVCSQKDQIIHKRKKVIPQKSTGTNSVSYVVEFLLGLMDVSPFFFRNSFFMMQVFYGANSFFAKSFIKNHNF